MPSKDAATRHLIPVQLAQRPEPVEVERHALVSRVISPLRNEKHLSERVADRGPLPPMVRPDGIIHATWNYDIEGSEQSEEQLLKLDGDTLYIGSGELEERGPGQMVLKDPAKVVFEKALKEVEMSEPAIDSEEAAPLVTAVKEAVSKLAGAPVNLDGGLRLTQGWVRFLGFISPAEGAEVKNEAFAGSIGDEFQILLKQDADKKWKLIRHGFRGAEGYFELEEASEEYETAPWPLEEELFVP